MLPPERGEFHPDHPLGCHRRRIPDRVVFEHIVEALAHGSGYQRIASCACSDATIRRRLKQWAAAGIAEQIHAVALDADQRIIGLLLADIGTDCITKAPAAGTRLDRTGGPTQGRPEAVGGHRRRRVPLGIVSAGANRHDSPLLGPTLHAAATQIGADWPVQLTVHLDAAYDSAITRTLLDRLGLHGEIARKGVPAPVQGGKRWVAERTHVG